LWADKSEQYNKVAAYALDWLNLWQEGWVL